MSNLPISFEDSVKLKIKSIIADLIPEERWDGIVLAVTHEFLNKELPNLVKVELANHFRSLIAEELKKPEFMADYSSGQMLASGYVSKMIMEMAPQILANMIGHQVQLQIQNATYELGRKC